NLEHSSAGDQNFLSLGREADVNRDDSAQEYERAFKDQQTKRSRLIPRQHHNKPFRSYEPPIGCVRSSLRATSETVSFSRIEAQLSTVRFRTTPRNFSGERAAIARPNCPDFVLPARMTRTVA